MRINISIGLDTGLDTPEDVARVASLFGAADTAAATVTIEPEPAEATSTRRRTRRAKASEPAPAEQPVSGAAETPAAEPASDADVFAEDEVVEEAKPIEKADVAKALRAWMVAKGADEGPKAALKLLAEFGPDVKRFDQVRPEDYGKLLSRINQSS